MNSPRPLRAVITMSCGHRAVTNADGVLRCEDSCHGAPLPRPNRQARLGIIRAAAALNQVPPYGVDLTRPALTSVTEVAVCQCGDPRCECDCIGNYPCEHGSLGAGCGS